MNIIQLDEKERRALFARFAKIAYSGPKLGKEQGKKLGFSAALYIDERGAQTYIFHNKTDIVITCRGTEPSQLNDIYADLEIFKADSVTGSKIHQGFKEEVDKIYDQVEKRLAKYSKGRKIWCTGHSLGGAMATILSQRLEFRGGHDIDTLYTYGSPRAGGPQFRSWCDRHLNHQRFVNNNDVVPCVPSWFRWRHTGDCLYIKSTGEVTKLARWSSERIRDKGYSLLSAILKGRFDIVADHNIQDYIDALEADLKQ